MNKLTPEQFCDSKIVAVTANSGQQIKNECKEAGMLEFIPKPITSELLREVMNRHFYYGALP